MNKDINFVHENNISSKKIIHHPNNQIKSVKICVIRGRLREKNLRHLRNLREIKIRVDLCNLWEVKIIC